MTIVEELRAKVSRDNRELLDRAADRIEDLDRNLAAAYKRIEELEKQLPPCKVGDYVRFKGLVTPWKVTAMHFYDAEGDPQISITCGKVTSTMTLTEFSEYAFVLTKEEAERALKERCGQ